MKTNIWSYQPSWQGKLATVEIQRVTFRKLALRRSANQICENESSVGTSSKRKPSIRKKQPIYSVNARHAFHKLSSPAEEVQLMAFFIILRRFIGKYDLPNHSSQEAGNLVSNTWKRGQAYCFLTRRTERKKKHSNQVTMRHKYSHSEQRLWLLGV